MTPTPTPTAPAAVQSCDVRRWHAGGWHPTEDLLAVEEPLEIRLDAEGPDGVRTVRPLSVTLRTPGDDAALATGFLVSESVVRTAADLQGVETVAPNVVCVRVRDGLRVDLFRLERHVYTSSSCGLCGKSSLEAVALQGCPPVSEPTPKIPLALLSKLPDRLRAAQAAFARTGGLHATGLFTADGTLLCVREDVGRHNAFDKAVGWALQQGLLPLSQALAVVSGRASFELVQKAALAGLRVMVAVGAPSSLAVSLARQQGLTLAGFVREGRGNLYAGSERVLHSPAEQP